MNSNFAKAFGIGVAAVAVMVGIVLYMQKDAAVALKCQVKARTLATRDIESLVIADLHLTNSSSYPFVIRDISVTLETANGDMTRGVVARCDAERFIAATPQSGPYHQPYITKARIPAGATVDYTVLAPFPIPEKMITEGKRLRFTILELDGKSFDFFDR